MNIYEVPTPKGPEDVNANQDPNKILFLSLSEVCKRIGMSRDTVLRMVDEGRFPRPMRLSERKISFVESEIVAWQLEKMSERAS